MTNIWFLMFLVPMHPGTAEVRSEEVQVIPTYEQCSEIAYSLNRVVLGHPFYCVHGG